MSGERELGTAQRGHTGQRVGDFDVAEDVPGVGYEESKVTVCPAPA